MIPPRLKASGRRFWAPVIALAAALVLAVGLRWAQVSARPAVVTESHGELPSLPSVTATPMSSTPSPAATSEAGPTPVVPVVDKRAPSRLDRVYASLVVAMRRTGGESAVRELQRDQAVWETGRRRDCGRQAGDNAKQQCASRLATLRAQELSELLERMRSR